MERALVRTTAKEGEESYETAEVRGLLAMARTFSGDIRGAVEDYKRALPRLIVGRDQLAATTGQNVHNARARRIIEAYMSLLVQISSDELESELGLDIAEQLFQVANVAQNSSVQRALAAAAVRSTPDDPLLAETLRREQDAAQEKNWALNTLATLEFAPPSQVDGDIIKTLRGRVLELRAARQTLVSEIRAKFPEFSRLMTPKPTSLAEVQAHLRPGEAMIATYVGKRRSFVWAVPAAGRPAFHAAPISRADLRDMVGLLRGALDPRPQTLADIPTYDLETAHFLYQELLAPIEATWRPAKSLIVVAHGPLGLLPFALLPTEPAKLPRKGALLFDGYRAVPWLARSHAVTVLPSVASLLTLRATPRSSAPRRAFVGFGDPWFSSDQAALVQDRGDQPVMLAAGGEKALRGLPIRLRSLPVMDNVDSAELARLPRLPDTADELRSIALALNADPTQDVFIGAEASETRVKTMDLSGRKVIAFATHGMVAGDLNGLTQPALAFSSPAVVGGEDDGLLTMGEVLGLKLDADWVVLSACNTGSAAGAGAEAISGLGRAFFYAGARALLVSNWPVHSDAAKSLTTDVFRRQAADQGGFKDASGQMLFSYAHPLFWAPFSIVGDGG